CELFAAVSKRMEALNNPGTPFLDRMNSQMRILGIIEKWLETYPGDFAHLRTRQQLTYLIEDISTVKEFAVAANEMRAQLDMVVEEDDTGWSKSDCDMERPVDMTRSATMDSF